MTFHGSPILFAVTVPNAAPHRDVAERFTAFLLSPEGQGILRAQHFDVIDTPLPVGAGIPALIQNATAHR